MYDAGDPAENCENDVEEELCAAAGTQDDGERWEEDGDDCFAAADLCAGQYMCSDMVWSGMYSRLPYLRIHLRFS